jgi:hypothetical protein
VEVIEDRLVADEPLQTHDLFGQQGAVLAELDVALALDAAETLIGGHGARIPAPQSIPFRLRRPPC